MGAGLGYDVSFSVTSETACHLEGYENCHCHILAGTPFKKTSLVNAVSFSLSSSLFLETRIYEEGQNGKKSPFAKMTCVWTGS